MARAELTDRQKHINPSADYLANVRSARAIPYWEQPPGFGRIGTELASRLPLPEDFRGLAEMARNLMGVYPGPMNDPMAALNLSQIPRGMMQDVQNHPVGNLMAMLGLPPGAEQAAMYAAAPNPLMTVFHGTPHRFAPTPENPLGQFDLSKIGTGEGAQAYGHGIYLAENPEVAGTYSNVGITLPMTTPTQAARAALADFGNRDKAIKALENPISGDSYYGNLANRTAAIDILRAGGRPKSSGNIYRVDLPDEQIARMLNWDAPMRGQPPNVQQAMAGLDLPNPNLEIAAARRRAIPVWQQRMESATNVPERNMYSQNIAGALREIAQLERQSSNAWMGVPGSDFYSMVAKESGGPQYASQLFGSRGIPGLQYFDQGSRAAGQGTRNFVVWQPDILKILGIE